MKRAAALARVPRMMKMTILDPFVSTGQR